MKTLRVYLIATVVCTAVPAGILFYHLFVAIPVGAVYPAEVRVAQGDSLAVVARKLREQKIISAAAKKKSIRGSIALKPARHRARFWTGWSRVGESSKA